MCTSDIALEFGTHFCRPLKGVHVRKRVRTILLTYVMERHINLFCRGEDCLDDNTVMITKINV